MESKSNPTNKASIQIPLKDYYKNVSYTPDKEDAERIQYVHKRRMDMTIKRRRIDRNWQLYVKQFESMYRAYKDGSHASNIQIERAPIETFIAKTIKVPPVFNFDSMDGKETETRIWKALWEHQMKQSNISDMFIENDYTAGIFGTSVIYHGHNTHQRVIHDLDIESLRSGNQEYQFNKKLETKESIITKNLDLRHFYLDDGAENIDEANDCIMMEYVPMEHLSSMKLNPNYKNLEYVTGMFKYHENNRIYVSK